MPLLVNLSPAPDTDSENNLKSEHLRLPHLVSEKKTEEMKLKMTKNCFF